MKLLSSFWEKNGRVLALLNPFARTPRLTAWLNEQGVVPQEDRVIGLANFLGKDENGNPKVTKGTIKDAGFVVVNSGTKITKNLEGNTKRLLGTTQSLQFDESKKATAYLRFIPLLESVTGFWGETDLLTNDDQAFFDPKNDHLGPLHLAVAVEKGGVEDPRVQVETARLVVFGNSEVLTGKAHRLTEGLSSDLVINALNWLLDREEIIGIAPKDKRNTTLSLDESQLQQIGIGVMAIIPSIVALLGLLVWSYRRN